MGDKTRYRAALGAIVLVATTLMAASPAAAMPLPSDGPSETASDATTGSPGSVALVSGTATIVGAGDIASCSGAGDSKTEATINSIPGTVFTLGDNVYPYGSLSNFRNCYAPTWGTFKSRTRPVPGNHDYYLTPGASGYFSYFGSVAGPSGLGYYAYNAGAWRIYALNSECSTTSTCYANQYSWLKSDLAANPHQCVLAMWHRPAFSTGPHGNSTRMAKFFQLLYSNGAEIVLNGHDHMYERYKPITPSGALDATHGIREFVVGTGGESLYGYKTTSSLIAVRNNTTFGVLRLDLSAGSYTWQFVPSGTGNFTDSGTGTCH
jgi:3',5'-cyclic AMP phosphodiesterase CpdA